MGDIALRVASGYVVETEANGDQAEQIIEKVTELSTSNRIGEEC